MPRSLYEYLPPEVRARHPLETLDAPVAAFLGSPNVPDDYDPARATALAQKFIPALPAMSQMRAMTSRVRAGMRGELPPQYEGEPRSDRPGAGVSWAPDEAPAQTSFGRPLPAGSRTTAEMYPGLTPPAKAAARVLASATQAVPNVSGHFGIPAYTTRDLVPPPENAAEHVADIAGGLAGFTATAYALGSIPGVSGAGAAGATGALQEGTLKERAIRGTTMAAAAGAGHAAGARIARAMPTPAGMVAAQAPSAVAFGAAQPWADAYLHRLTGEEQHPLPGGWESAQGVVEMLAINLLMGGKGIVDAEMARRAEAAGLDRAQVAAAIQRAKALAGTLRPPGGIRPEDAAASKRLSERLNGVLAGKTVRVALPDGSGQQGVAKVGRVIAYRMPNGEERIHLVVTDPTGSVVPLTFRSTDDLVASVSAAPRMSGTVGPAIVPDTELARAARGQTAPAAISAALADAEGRLARLTAAEPPKNDKGHRRWEQRVERLTAERDALRARTSSAPLSAPGAPETNGGARITPPREKPVNYRQIGTADLLGLAGQGDAQARAEWERRQKKLASGEAVQEPLGLPQPPEPPPAAPPPEPAKPTGPTPSAEGGPGMRGPEPSVGSPTPAETSAEDAPENPRDPDFVRQVARAIRDNEVHAKNTRAELAALKNQKSKRADVLRGEIAAAEAHIKELRGRVDEEMVNKEVANWYADLAERERINELPEARRPGFDQFEEGYEPTPEELAEIERERALPDTPDPKNVDNYRWNAYDKLEEYGGQKNVRMADAVAKAKFGKFPWEMTADEYARWSDYGHMGRIWPEQEVTGRHVPGSNELEAGLLDMPVNHVGSGVDAGVARGLDVFSAAFEGREIPERVRKDFPWVERMLPEGKRLSARDVQIVVHRELPGKGKKSPTKLTTEQYRAEVARIIKEYGLTESMAGRHTIADLISAREEWQGKQASFVLDGERIQGHVNYFRPEDSRVVAEVVTPDGERIDVDLEDLRHEAEPPKKPKGGGSGDGGAGKPLEQQSLEGMPQPRIPGGAKRSMNDESADIVKAMGAEPEPNRQTGMDFSGAGGAGPESGNSRFSVGANVRVPNETNRRNDKRLYVNARIVGHTEMRHPTTGEMEPAVVVMAQRGTGKDRKFSWTQHTFPERLVRLKPTMASREAAAKVRAGKESRLRASLAEKVGGSAAKATRLIEQFEDAQAEASRAAGEDPKNPAYPKARRAYLAADAAIGHLRDIRRDILGGPDMSGERGLAPDVRKAFDAKPDGAAWSDPLRTAGEDHPQHFTPERQRAYLTDASQGALANAAELRMRVETERELAEAGVSPEQAARAADATDVIRRYIHHERDNPLYDAKEANAAVAWAEELLTPERLRTPEGVAAALKEFEARVEPSPADDVPAGTRHLTNERGFIDAGFPTFHEYLRALREVPKRFREAVRAIPRKERPHVRDQHGNVVRRFHDLLERDRFTESAWSRFASAFMGGKFARPIDVLTVEQQLAHKAVTPAERGHFGLITEKWQEALAGRSISAYSGLSARIAGIMDGSTNGGLPKDFKDLPRRLERAYHDIRRYRNEQVAAYGIDPIYSFGVRRVLAEVSPVEGEAQWLIQTERAGKPIMVLDPKGGDTAVSANRLAQFVGRSWHGLKVVGVTEHGELMVNTTGGMEPLTRYGGPHIIMGQMAESAVPMLEAVLGRKLDGPERIEVRDRFAGMRLGAESDVKDAALQFELYRDMTSRYLARVPFLKRVAADLPKMRAEGDAWRAGLLEAWIRAQMFPKRGGFDRLMDGAARYLFYSRSPFAGHPIDRDAARYWADTIGARIPGWADGFYSVPGEAKVAFEDGRVEMVGRNRHGDMLVAVKGRGPVDAREPELRAGFQLWNDMKASSWAKVAKMANALPEGVSQETFRRMLLRKYRHEALLNYRSPGNIFYRAIGMNTLRAYIGMNPKALLANYLQPSLTLAPEVGWRRTASAMAHGVGRPGREGAERIGSLQGEVRRMQEASSGLEPSRGFKGLARLLLSAGPLSPYRFSEDYTRGVSFLAARALATRLGMPFEAALRAVEPGSHEYHQNQLDVAEAMRKKGTGESLAAMLDTRAMYDYDALGRPPIFGSGIGRLFGALSTFPMNAVPELVMRPVGGATKVATATARGVLNLVSAGTLGRARPSARGGTVEQSYVRRSGRTDAARNQWLEAFGANEYAQRDAMMFLKQSLATGVVLGATVATGANFALGGTPGHEIMVLLALRWLFGKDERVDAALKAAYAQSQRTAVWDPGHGVPMSPFADAIVRAMKGEGVAAGAELARAQVPLKAVLVRYLQNRQDASRLREGGDLHWLALVLGIRSVTPSGGAIEEAARNLGLQSRAGQDAGRQNVKTPKRRKRKDAGFVGSLVSGEQPRASA